VNHYNMHIFAGRSVTEDERTVGCCIVSICNELSLIPTHVVLCRFFKEKRLPFLSISTMMSPTDADFAARYAKSLEEWTDFQRECVSDDPGLEYSKWPY